MKVTKLVSALALVLVAAGCAQQQGSSTKDAEDPSQPAETQAEAVSPFSTPFTISHQVTGKFVDNATGATEALR